MKDDYEERRNQRREDERRYQADVSYDVWRSGGNPDRVNPERVSDQFHNGVDSQSAARRELIAQKPKPRQEEQEQQEEQFPEEQP